MLFPWLTINWSLMRLFFFFRLVLFSFLPSRKTTIVNYVLNKSRDIYIYYVLCIFKRILHKHIIFQVRPLPGLFSSLKPFDIVLLGFQRTSFVVFCSFFVLSCNGNIVIINVDEKTIKL